MKDPGPPAANLDSETGKPIPNQTLEEEDPKGKEARILHRKLFEEQRQKFKPYQGCWKKNTCPEIFVTEMQVSGDTTKLSKLKVNPKFERVNIRSEVKRATPLKQVPQSLHNKQISSLLPRPQQLSVASKMGVNELTSAPRLYAQSYGYERNTNANTWAPTNGKVQTEVYEYHQYGEDRYIYNEFYWAGENRLTGFAENSGYEHDFFLNNSSTSTLGTGTYLTTAQRDDGIPLIRYAESNLPRPYLDTRIADASYQVAFTVGSAQAGGVNGIDPYVMYNTYIIARQGTANQDNAFINVQLGIRDPSFCYTTWCVYSVDQRAVRDTTTWWIPIPHLNVPWTKTIW